MALTCRLLELEMPAAYLVVCAREARLVHSGLDLVQQLDEACPGASDRREPHAQFIAGLKRPMPFGKTIPEKRPLSGGRNIGSTPC